LLLASSSLLKRRPRRVTPGSCPPPFGPAHDIQIPGQWRRGGYNTRNSRRFNLLQGKTGKISKR
jgi:hypothetical protein